MTSLVSLPSTLKTREEVAVISAILVEGHSYYRARMAISYDRIAARSGDASDSRAGGRGDA